MRTRLAVASGLIAAAPTFISAEATATEKRERDEDASSSEDGNSVDFGHGGQLGLRVGVVGGYRMTFRYDNSPFCIEPDPATGVQDQQQFCGHQAPWALDLTLSYGLLDSLELIGWGRFGLEGDDHTETDPEVTLGAGVRLYTMSSDRLKIFVQPAAGMSLEKGREEVDRTLGGQFTPEYKTDLVFHLSAGPQFDFNEYFGLYASGGLTVGVIRYLSATLEGQAGIQGRYP